MYIAEPTRCVYEEYKGIFHVQLELLLKLEAKGANYNVKT